MFSTLAIQASPLAFLMGHANPMEELGKALRGNATPVSEQLQKSYGMGPVSSNLAALPINVLTDPYASLTAGKTAEAVKAMADPLAAMAARAHLRA